MISRNRGFGLVEIMVGLAIGLITMLVILQVSSVFENQKRATTTGGDAQTNGALALYALEREVRAAGNGMTEGEPQKYPALAGCTTRIFDALAYRIPNFDPSADSLRVPIDRPNPADVRLAPVLASDGGNSVGGPGGLHLSDSLTIAYGTSSITAPYTLTASYAAGAPTISLSSGSGIGVGDMVALVEEERTPPTNPYDMRLNPCSLLQVTGIPAAGLVPVAGGTRYNNAGGTGLPDFTSEARLFNLGQLNLVTYRVADINPSAVITDNSSLVADVSKFGVIPNGTALPGTVTNRTDFTPLASNIVNMQVQYGVDTGNPTGPIQTSCKIGAPGTPLAGTDADAVIDAWVAPTLDPLTGTNWANNGVTTPLGTPSVANLRRIRAVRIGLVARSGVKEVATDDSLCTTTTVAPTISWDADPLTTMRPDLATGHADWRCYRYKVFQATIPVRNALWSSTMNPASSASCGLRDPA